MLPHLPAPKKISHHALNAFIGLMAMFFTILPAKSQEEYETSVSVFNIHGYTLYENSEEKLPNVTIELVKNNEVQEVYYSSNKGKYIIGINVEQHDTAQADYKIVFSKEGMLTKSIAINTFIKDPDADVYDYRLDLTMAYRKPDDIVIDLPSAKIVWDDQLKQYSFDVKYAIVAKQMADEEIKKVKLFVQEVVHELELKLRAEDERRVKEKSETTFKENVEELQLVSELVRVDVVDSIMKKQLMATNNSAKPYQPKLREFVINREEKNKNTGSATSAPVFDQQLAKNNPDKKQVDNNPANVSNKKDEHNPIITKQNFSSNKAPQENKTNYSASKEIESEEEFSKTIQNIYSIYDNRSSRNQSILLAMRNEKNKRKNNDNKYETKNPFTSLLDEIDAYEKGTGQTKQLKPTS